MTFPLPIPFGETWQVLRGTEERDRFGDQAIAVHHTIEGCVFWPSSPDSGSGAAEDNDRRQTSTENGSLAVPREADLLSTDRVRRSLDGAGGTLWHVLGPAQWTMNHPMTGWNPGYKVYRVRGVR